MTRGGGFGFLKILGPQGQTKWDSSVPPGYEGRVLVHICGPWAPNKPFFVQKKKYFWKSYSKPSGTSIIVPPENDLIGQAIDAAQSNPAPEVQQFIKNYGKARTSYLFNVLQLDNPQVHIGQDGVMRTLILDEGKQLFNRILGLCDEGAKEILDYQHGRPVKIIRKKTGPQVMDIEWDAQRALHPSPVPQQFWPALQNLWDLEKFVKYPTVEEMQLAIQDMGLPMPGQSVQMQVPASYNPAPSAPHPNPYQAPPQQPMPSQAPPPANFGPPPMHSMGGQPAVPSQVAQMGIPASAPPPGLNPPPISSVAPEMPSAAGPPPVPAAPPQQQALTLPLPPGTTLDGGRERCFGHYHPTDNLCLQCPPQIKDQCVRLSPQQQAPQQVDGGLAALQQQLQG
jgi:hypothetical protein